MVNIVKIIYLESVDRYTKAAAMPPKFAKLTTIPNPTPLLRLPLKLFPTQAVMRGIVENDPKRSLQLVKLPSSNILVTYPQRPRMHLYTE